MIATKLHLHAGSVCEGSRVPPLTLQGRGKDLTGQCRTCEQWIGVAVESGRVGVALAKIALTGARK